MSIVTFIKGEVQEFVSLKDFALNFEDRSVKSVKVKVGESVFYDGETALHKKASGEETKGRCPNLKSAINVMGWLVLKEKTSKKSKAAEKKETTEEAPLPPRSGDYDGFRGGNFDTFATRSNGDVHVAHFRKPQVIKEVDLVVKDNTFGKKASDENRAETNLEVAGDQVEVKKGFTVSSSTSVNKEEKRKMAVVQRDEMGSESTTKIKGVKAAHVPGKKKDSFVIDDKTPLTIGEDMTSEEVQKMKTVVSEESQDGKVVGKIDRKKMVVEAQDADGVTLKKKTIEGITITTGTQAQKEMSVKAKVSSGSDPITAIQDDGKVVGKVHSAKEVDTKAADKAAARAAARKASAKQTQAEVEKERKAVKKEAAPVVEGDFLSRLPAGWGKLHWVKKEAFIKSLTDIEFIKYILSMETIKAVQNACNERLKELE